MHVGFFGWGGFAKCFGVGFSRVRTEFYYCAKPLNLGKFSKIFSKIIKNMKIKEKISEENANFFAKIFIFALVMGKYKDYDIEIIMMVRRADHPEASKFSISLSNLHYKIVNSKKFTKVWPRFFANFFKKQKNKRESFILVRVRERMPLPPTLAGFNDFSINILLGLLWNITRNSCHWILVKVIDNFSGRSWAVPPPPTKTQRYSDKPLVDSHRKFYFDFFLEGVL